MKAKHHSFGQLLFFFFKVVSSIGCYTPLSLAVLCMLSYSRETDLLLYACYKKQNEDVFWQLEIWISTFVFLCCLFNNQELVLFSKYEH